MYIHVYIHIHNWDMLYASAVNYIYTAIMCEYKFSIKLIKLYCEDGEKNFNWWLRLREPNSFLSEYDFKTAKHFYKQNTNPIF